MTNETMLFLLTGLTEAGLQTGPVHPAALTVARDELDDYLLSISALGRAQYVCLVTWQQMNATAKNWREN